MVDTCSLREATELNQQVHGTTSTSRYTVVLLGSQFNVAARWLGGTVSLRVEPRGPKFSDPALVMSLKDAGFTVPEHEMYASIHLPLGGIEAVTSLCGLLGALVHLHEDPAEVATFKTLVSDLCGVGA